MKALILAGGRGTRLQPYTNVLPKPLMPVGDYPILEILLRQLRRAGVRDVTLAVGYMSELFRSFFAGGERLGLNMNYSFEDKPLGTAGPIAAVLHELPENFIISNGDLLTTLDFKAMYDTHVASGAAATIGLHSREVRIDFGVVDFGQDGLLKSYREKPVMSFDVSMGVNILRRDAVEQFLKPGEYLDIPDLMQMLCRDGQAVRAYRSNCHWLDIGRVDDYQVANQMMEECKDLFLPQED